MASCWLTLLTRSKAKCSPTGLLKRAAIVVYGNEAHVEMGTGVITLFARWLSPAPEELFKYDETADKVTITGLSSDWDSSDVDHLLSDTIGGLPEKAIEIRVFRSTDLNTVVIPDSVILHGIDAFASCDSLVAVTLSGSVTNVSDSIFKGCSSVTAVTISVSVMNIGNYTFDRCSCLESVALSASVSSIGTRAFTDSDSLEKFTVSENNIA